MCFRNNINFVNMIYTTYTSKTQGQNVTLFRWPFFVIFEKYALKIKIEKISFVTYNRFIFLFFPFRAFFSFFPFLEVSKNNVYLHLIFIETINHNKITK